MPNSASAVALWSTALMTSEAVVDRFSTNAICRQHNCINPIFPGLQDLQKLKAATWTCPDPDSKPSLKFCGGAIQHRVALMERDSEAVEKQEQMASTAYFYHLSGMKMDPWDNRDPEARGDACAQAVWHMVCSTYLPKAPVHCNKGETIPYLLPCQSECRGYLNACNVECCDESVQCTLEKGSHFEEPFRNFTGYSPAMAPSAECTGNSARRSAGVSLLLLLSAVSSWGSMSRSNLAVMTVLLVSAMNLQGCDIMISHSSGTWETRPNYMLSFAVKSAEMEEDSGVTTATTGGRRMLTKSTMNSCSLDLDDSQKCNGHGKCKEFVTGVSFCQCATGWSDPECRTARKSQRSAFLLSLFTGFLGLDRFYLGELSAGTLKLATLGGFGTWWLWDIMWIGSAPIYTRSHGRLAADLPHHIFVILAVIWVAFMSYFIFGVIGAMWHESRILNRALLKVEQIQHHLAKQRLLSQNEDMEGMPRKTTMRVAAPPGTPDFYGSMAQTPPEVKLAAYKNEMSPFFLYAKASEQPQVKNSGAFQRIGSGSSP